MSAWISDIVVNSSQMDLGASDARPNQYDMLPRLESGFHTVGLLTEGTASKERNKVCPLNAPPMRNAFPMLECVIAMAAGVPLNLMLFESCV